MPLREWMDRHPRLFVLTGAGVSTGSGIPGYRDMLGQWQRRQPITHQAFTCDEAARKRYWARSMLGCGVMADAAPNAAHVALVQLERAGRIGQLVTQNVDGLHQRAGSAQVIELHGGIRHVACLQCQALSPRSELQVRLEAANPAFLAFSAATAPDGDADLELADFDAFEIPACLHCGGMLKPDVVFFGANVPRARADAAMDALTRADAVLVAGSSLMVYSGYRFCERAHAAGKPIAAINLGHTRADDKLTLKIEADCATVLAQLANQIGSVSAAEPAPAQ